MHQLSTELIKLKPTLSLSHPASGFSASPLHTHAPHPAGCPSSWGLRGGRAESRRKRSDPPFSGRTRAGFRKCSLSLSPVRARDINGSGGGAGGSPRDLWPRAAAAASPSRNTKDKLVLRTAAVAGLYIYSLARSRCIYRVDVCVRARASDACSRSGASSDFLLIYAPPDWLRDLCPSRAAYEREPELVAESAFISKLSL